MTRETILSMAQDDVVDLLLFHGCPIGGTLDEQRTRLISAVFVDI